jgi:hypothetical protein
VALTGYQGAINIITQHGLWPGVGGNCERVKAGE